MKIVNKLTFVACVSIAALVGTTPAAAQLTRSYVSGFGDDANPCDRFAPCRTFTAALATTSPGGTINCLDPAGYGTLAITKAVTIDCHFTEGGVLASATGITVNAGASDQVVIRGLDLHGDSATGHGISVTAAAAVFVQDCTITNFASSGSYGIRVQASGATSLYVLNSVISGNGSGTTGGGIGLSANGTSAFLRANLKNVQILHNATGISGDANGGAATYLVFLGEDMTIAGNATGAQFTANLGTGSIYGTLARSSVSNQSGSGIVADGAAVNLRALTSAITFNRGTGVQIVNGGKVVSYGDNVLELNSADGAFTLTVAKK